MWGGDPICEIKDMRYDLSTIEAYLKCRRSPTEIARLIYEHQIILDNLETTNMAVTETF